MSTPLVRNSGQTDVVQTAAFNNNQSPLPPGTAAGIKQAQSSQIAPLLAIGIVVGIFLVGVLLLHDDDDDDGPVGTTTGT